MNLPAQLMTGAACAAVILCAKAVPAAPAPAVEPVYATKVFGLDSGLPSDVASAFLQSPKGYLWVGTEGGLVRYDGAKFDIFRASGPGGLPDNLIRCLGENNGGFVLVGTQRGLARYRRGRIEQIWDSEQRIADMARDPDGRVWIATLTSGLWDYWDNKFTSHANDPNLKGSTQIIRLFSDSSGRLWVSARPNGIFVREKGIFTAYRGIGPDSGELYRMYEYPRGTLWFATTKALYRVRGCEVRTIGQKEGLGTENVTSFCTDHEGRLWVTARGLYRSLDPRGDSFVQVPTAGDPMCRAVFADREGSIWVGTSGSGILQLRETAFRTGWTTPAGMPTGGVRVISQSADGSIWAALAPNGFARIYPDGRSVAIPLGLERESEVRSILAASDGRVWIGTRGAMLIWKDGRLERFPDYADVGTLYEDRSGAVWIGPANRGVVRWRSGRFESLAGVIGSASSNAAVFAEGRQGALYIGMDEGLAKFADGRASVFNPGPVVSDFAVRSIHEDSRGNLWVGTKRRGLVLLHEGRWYNPDSMSESMGDLVSAIVEDNRGSLWLGTAKGIVWGSEEAFLAACLGQQDGGILHWAGSSEGIQASTIGYGSQPVSLAAKDGSIWFVSHAGLIQVDPAATPFNATPPLVQVEKVTVDGVEAEASGQVILPPGTRSVAVDYAALSFIEPSAIVFRYRLEGHDNAWIDAGVRRTAYYANLRPGNYQFRVLARNGDGIWNTTGAVMGLVQKPRYYETWWFYTCAALSVAVLALGVLRLRTRALLKENERLERGIAERTQELVQARKMEAVGQLAGGVAHDFNNILTAILMQLGLLLEEKDLDPFAKAGLQDLEKQAKRAASLTRQLLAFSRRQVMRSRPFDINAMLDELFRMLRRLLGEAISLEFKDGHPLWIDGDIAMIEQVVTNLCLNARDAMTPKGGRLLIETSLREVKEAEAKAYPEARPGSFVRLSVTDTGCGMDEKVLQHIFEPFFTTKEISKGTGLGLATVYGIVKQHQGWVKVESKVGSGSTFSLFLPARSAPGAAEPGVAVERAPQGKETILLVEDEKAVRRMSCLCLQKFGYRVIEVSDGREAISVWDECGPKIDLLFSDMVMPNGITGLDLAERFRQTKPGLKVIITSGYSVDLRKAGASGKSGFMYLAKPYEMRNLAAIVRNCLDGAGDC
jgi:signal transduction histidine kinase/ligand-binding sensor domain-containing protein/CheY-like chemotaxis protein